MFLDFNLEGALILIIIILAIVVLFMIDRKVKIKYYIIGFFMLLISFAIFVQVNDPHGSVWVHRILHHFGW